MGAITKDVDKKHSKDQMKTNNNNNKKSINECFEVKPIT